MATLQQQTNDTGSPISFLKSSNNTFSTANPFSTPSPANQTSKPTTPGSQPQLATAGRNLPPQVPPTYSPVTLSSPGTRVSPMQRLCNQAKAVMELARGYQKEEQYQFYSGSAGYSNGRGSVASIPDVIPFDNSQSSPPRSSVGVVASAAAAGVPAPAIKFEGREREAVMEAHLSAPLVEYQPDEFIGADSFLGDWPGFEYLMNGDRGTGYYNLGRPQRCTSLTAAAAAKANRHTSAASVPLPAQHVSALLHPLGQRSVSESHIAAPQSSPTLSSVAATANILPNRVGSCTTLLAASGSRTTGGVFPFDDSPSPPQARSHSAGKSSSTVTTPSPTVSANTMAGAPAVAGLTIAAVAALGGSLAHLQFPATASLAATGGSAQVTELGSAALSVNLSSGSATATSIEAAQWQPFPEPPAQAVGTAATATLLSSGSAVQAGLGNGQVHHNGNTTAAALRPAFVGSHPPAHALHPYIYYPPSTAQAVSQASHAMVPGPHPPPNPPPVSQTHLMHSASHHYQYAGQQQHQVQHFAHANQHQQDNNNQHFRPSGQSLSRSHSQSQSHTQSQQSLSRPQSQSQQPQHFENPSQQQLQQHSSQPQQQFTSQQLQSFSQLSLWQQSQQNSQQNSQHNTQHNTQHNSQHNSQHSQHNSQLHSQHNSQQNSQQQQQQQLQLPAHLVASPQTWAQRGGPPLLTLQHISQLPPEVQHMLHQKTTDLKNLAHQMQQQRQHRFKLTGDLSAARRHIFALEAQIADAATAAALPQVPQHQPSAGRACLPIGSRSLSLDLGSRSVSAGGVIGMSAGPTVPALQARVLNLEGQLTATLAKFATLSQQLETRGSEAEKSSEETSRQMEKTQEIQQGTELQAQSLMQQLRESRAMLATAAAQSDSKDQVIELLLSQLAMMTEQVAEMGPVGQHMEGMDEGGDYFEDDGDGEGYYDTQAYEDGVVVENGDEKEENGQVVA